MKSQNKLIKIGLVGHGSGGHFYPLIAVGESIKALAEKNSESVEIVYYGPTPYHQESLDSIGAKFSKVPAGKSRNYFSLLNFLDVFKLGWGCVVAFFKLIAHYPDVIFSKGGFAAFPVLVAARLLFIPIVIHDSDIIPGRVSMLSEKWARRVALSWPQAQQYITNTHTAVTGTPIRKGLITGSQDGGRAFLDIPNEAVVILILGGSQGAEVINTAVLAGITELLKDFHIIHQVGEANYSKLKLATDTLLSEDQKSRYHLFGNLNELAMARSLGAADIVITRAGASGLFETAAVGAVPAFVIPITNSVNNHQRENAYAYQDAGAGIVIEEANLKPDILVNDIKNLLTDLDTYQAMKESAKQFSPIDAADKIAIELIQIAHEH